MSTRARGKALLWLATITSVVAVCLPAGAHDGRHATVGSGGVNHGSINYRLEASIVDAGGRDSGTISLRRWNCGLNGQCNYMQATYRVLCAYTDDRSSSLGWLHHTQVLAVKVFGARGLPKSIGLGIDDAQGGDRVGITTSPTSGPCSANVWMGGGGSFQTVGFLNDL